MSTLTSEEFRAVCEIVAADDPRLTDHSQCSICMTEFSDEPEVIVRQIHHCHHLFHETCLEEWLTKGARTCPLCRGQSLIQEPCSTSRIHEPFELTMIRGVLDTIDVRSLRLSREELEERAVLWLSGPRRMRITEAFEHALSIWRAERDRRGNVLEHVPMIDVVPHLFPANYSLTSMSASELQQVRPE